MATASIRPPWANTLNQGLNTIYALIGNHSDRNSHDTIQALPGGDNQTVRRSSSCRLPA
jgi:hypothetical protein